MLAFGVHVLVLVLLGVSFDWKAELMGSPEAQPTVQASVVSEAAVDQEREEIRRIAARYLDVNSAYLENLGPGYRAVACSPAVEGA